MYVDLIDESDITFGLGPAGTGKTWLAVAKAVEALVDGKVQRIVLVRPAVEAGEKLGFLPGSLQDKIDPFLIPLYDALDEMLGATKVKSLIESKTIELAPLAFMRGRTLKDAFILMDEAQNTTYEQMKMFLTRFGAGSKAVVTGDVTQTDLPAGNKSGLPFFVTMLHKVQGVGIHLFENSDIVRHPLVNRIVTACDAHELTVLKGKHNA